MPRKRKKLPKLERSTLIDVNRAADALIKILKQKKTLAKVEYDAKARLAIEMRRADVVTHDRGGLLAMLMNGTKLMVAPFADISGGEQFGES